MNFLLIITAVLLVHQGKCLRWIQKDQWFHTIFSSLSTDRNKSWLLLLILVIVPVALLLLLLSAMADSRIWLFVINGLVLLYAIGRGSWRQECARWVEVFSEQDPAVLREKLALAESKNQDHPEEEIETIWQRARSEVLYHQLSGFYAVIFWFFLLGAPAALLYRLLSLHQQQNITLEQSMAMDVDRVLWFLEWLPVRLMALLFCLVGHFSTSFWVLQQIMRDSFTPSADVLARCADAALFVDKDELNADESTSEEDAHERNRKRMERVTAKSLEKKTLAIMRGYCKQLQQLLSYVEVAFLSVLAVVILF